MSIYGKLLYKMGHYTSWTYSTTHVIVQSSKSQLHRKTIEVLNVQEGLIKIKLLIGVSYILPQMLYCICVSARFMVRLGRCAVQICGNIRSI